MNKFSQKEAHSRATYIKTNIKFITNRKEEEEEEETRSTIKAGIQQGQLPYSQIENGTPILLTNREWNSYSFLCPSVTIIFYEYILSDQ